MSLLNNKIAIVTGGTKGIGLETAKIMANEGAVVYACARNTGESIPNLNFHILDVTDIKSCQTLADDIINKHGKIDVLVANAGITADALTVKMTDDMFDSVIDTNLKGVFNIVKSVIPTMLEQKNGSIVTVSSIVGEYGNIGQANYAASKAGVIAMTKSWAKEFARKGENIRVNCIAPGYIMTDMLKTVPQNLLDAFSKKTMLNRLGNPEEVAKAILFLASDMSSYVTGTVLDVNGGMRL